MRISDWSSDVCSSDLGVEGVLDHLDRVVTLLAVQLLGDPDRGFAIGIGGVDDPLTALERVDLVQTLRHATNPPLPAAAFSWLGSGKIAQSHPGTPTRAHPPTPPAKKHAPTVPRG